MMLHVPFQCISPKLQSPIEPLKNPGLPNENQTHLRKKTTVGPRSSKFKVFFALQKVPKIPKNQRSFPTIQFLFNHAVDLAAIENPGLTLGGPLGLKPRHVSCRSRAMSTAPAAPCSFMTASANLRVLKSHMLKDDNYSWHTTDV